MKIPFVNKNFIFITCCLFILYASWGSSYLLLKMGLDYLPPILFSGFRMSLAGLSLLVFAYFKKEVFNITWFEIKRASILGIFLVVMGSAFLSIGQKSVPSGTAAIVYGATPIMLLLGGWLFAGEAKPSKIQFLGLILGFAMILWIKIHQSNHGEASFFGLFMIFLSACGWVCGSLLSRKKSFQTSLPFFLSAGLLMLTGGVETIVFGLVMGETLTQAAFSSEAITIFLIATFFPALLGFLTYLWLLVNARPIVAISYEYVTPVIAVYLGWQFANETINSTVVMACLGLVISVFLTISKDN